MKFGIMGAMPEEVDGIHAMLDDIGSEKIGGRTYWTGRFHGVDAVLVYSRCGKVSSASAATILFERFKVDAIFFIGVAGAAHPDLQLGDIVIATELIQHDVDASALPMFQRFEIPLLGMARFASPGKWVEVAARETGRYLAENFGGEFSRELLEEFGIARPSVRTGLIASGDQFMSNPAVVTELRTVLPDLLCLEMEGAAVAQICYEFDRPCIVARVISDRADHSAVVDFQKFIRRISAEITSRLAARIIPTLAKEEPPAVS
jgi:adenosylhomocysteine nucleosidase